jgi:hypothetical protein
MQSRHSNVWTTPPVLLLLVFQMGSQANFAWSWSLTLILLPLSSAYLGLQVCITMLAHATEFIEFYELKLSEEVTSTSKSLQTVWPWLIRTSQLWREEMLQMESQHYLGLSLIPFHSFLLSTSVSDLTSAWLLVVTFGMHH